MSGVELGCGSSGSDGCFWLRVPCWIIGTEAVDDASLLQVVGRHLHTHAVSGENANLVHAHTSGEVAEELMALGLLGCDADSKRRIGITFLSDADEFDDILGQVCKRVGKPKKSLGQAGGSYRRLKPRARLEVEWNVMNHAL